jgi:hypothetical protein
MVTWLDYDFFINRQQNQAIAVKEIQGTGPLSRPRPDGKVPNVFSGLKKLTTDDDTTRAEICPNNNSLFKQYW